MYDRRGGDRESEKKEAIEEKGEKIGLKRYLIHESKGSYAEVLVNRIRVMIRGEIVS